MPIHEFHCEGCDAKFEELIRSPKDETDLRCPKCGGEKIDRQFSTFAARATSAESKAAKMPAGGCGRCGDPGGPCSLG